MRVQYKGEWKQFRFPENWEEIHFDATVVDMHIHPALKASWFKRNLTLDNPLESPLKNVLNIDPFGFDPSSTRADFPKLGGGGIDVILSAVYALEKESMGDFVLKVGPFRGVRYQHISWLLPVLLRKVWQQYIRPDYFTVANNMMDLIEKQVGQSDDPPAAMAPSVEDLNAILDRQDGTIAVVHNVEGAHCLEDDEIGQIREHYEGQKLKDFDSGDIQTIQDKVVDNLQKLYDRGVAYITLGHFYPNVAAATTFPYPEHVLDIVNRERWEWIWRDLTEGLTDIGRKVVREMCRLGIIIDLCHCTPAVRREVYQIVEEEGAHSVVIASHAGAYALNPNPYNLTDREIRWIADHGGVIGVILSNYMLSGHGDIKLGLGHVARTIEHLIDVGGIGCVAVGSDLDGFSDPPDDVATAAQFFRLTQRLLVEDCLPENREQKHQQIRMILGENALRVLRNGWGRKRSP
jgi:microsomal dipeptidase-like Zn-dependent dipeptidase